MIITWSLLNRLQRPLTQEIGDWSDAYRSYWSHPESILIRLRLPNSELIIDGIDPFVLKVVKRDCFSSHTRERILYGQKSRPAFFSYQEILSQWTKKNPDRGFSVSAARYAEIVENGLGYYFKDPAEADSERYTTNRNIFLHRKVHTGFAYALFHLLYMLGMAVIRNNLFSCNRLSIVKSTRYGCLDPF